MTLAVSIVSHGHAEQVHCLLTLLARTSAGCVQRVWLTVNRPEAAFDGWLSNRNEFAGIGLPFELRVIHNAQPLGFGANHNQAFDQDQKESDPADWFCVMNPDIEWQHNPFPALLAAGCNPDVACVYPVQLTATGQLQDHQRALLTPGSLVRRLLLHQRGVPTGVDWVCGAFMVLRAAVFGRVRGFDPGYFMYCEDVDLCLRLQLVGGSLKQAVEAQVVHAAHRRSGVEVRHLWWHVGSLIRLWRSAPYRHYRALRHVHAG